MNRVMFQDRRRVRGRGCHREAIELVCRLRIRVKVGAIARVRFGLGATMVRRSSGRVGFKLGLGLGLGKGLRGGGDRASVERGREG